MSQMSLQQALDLGRSHHQAGELARAEEIYRAILSQVPGSADAIHLLGMVLCQSNRTEEGIALLEKSVQMAPVAGFWANLSAFLLQVGRVNDAIESAQRGTMADASNLDSWFNLASALQSASRVEESAAGFEKVLGINPDHIAALYRLCDLARQKGDLKRAAELQERIVQCQPNDLTALGRMAVLLCDTGRAQDALPIFDAIVHRDPNDFTAWNNRANALKAVGKFGEAVESCQKSVQLAPTYAGTWLNLGSMLLNAGRPQEAVNALMQASERGDVSGAAHSSAMLAMHNLDTIDDAALFQQHLNWAGIHAASGKGGEGLRAVDRKEGKVLKIGFVSADFYHHPVAIFMQSIFRNYDRSRFHFTSFYNNRVVDATTSRLRAMVDTWEDILHLPDEAFVESVKAKSIDILIDLGGHTALNRLIAFASRPAPVQVTYLGYLNTTGMQQIDYRLVDAITDPVGLTEKFHTEKLIRLPRTFACYTPPDIESPVSEAPCVRNGYVTFGFPGQLCKINHSVARAWGEILRRSPTSRLMIAAHGLGDPKVVKWTQEKFAAAGADLTRIDFEPNRPFSDWLKLHSRIDLALDPWPFNNHTTTLHGLWMGVPCLTMPQSRYSSRMGASVMTNVGMSEFIAKNQDEYVRKAVKFAGSMEKLAVDRLSLRNRLLASPLTDGRAFTADFQHALVEMWRGIRA